MISVADPFAINIEIPRIDSRCPLEKDFTELIHMNPLMVLCQIINHINLCHGCVCGPFT